MAINSNGILVDKNPTRSLCSSNASNISSCRLIKINFAGKDSRSSSKANNLCNRKDIKSPYLSNDKVQLLSRVTEKKLVHKKPSDFVSSFPLAVSVYKANSDEFKVSKRGNKKVKKSVLTLPNEPAPTPKRYALSDLNDSEYFANDNRDTKQKKRRPVKRTKKPRVIERTMEFYDRDARYCSQLNIDLDCSSSEIVNITGDGERISKLSYKSNNAVKANDHHDVWAVLRNINKFQFRPTPPESQDSVVPLRKRRPLVRNRNNCNDTRIIETCHTEEFAYISSFEIDSKSQESCSPSSSFDRVTVIDKQSEQDELMHQFNEQIFGSNVYRKDINKICNQNKGKNKSRLKGSNKKALKNKKKVEDNQTVQNKTPILLCDGNNTSPLSDRLNLQELLPERNESGSIIEIGSLHNINDVNITNNKKASTKIPDSKINGAKLFDNSEKQFNGITKVILCKGQNIVPPNLSEPPKKTRLALTLPNINIPKLTQTEIKRRLANLKFPIVILGKDQITNCAIHVTNIDPPQFNGLDQYIWPFMLEWSEEKLSQNIQNRDKKERGSVKLKNIKNKLKVGLSGDSKCDVVLKKGDELKKLKNNSFPITDKKNQQLSNGDLSQVIDKPKSISLLKSKMFNFLNKDNTSTKIANNNNLNKSRRPQTVQVDKTVGTNVTINTEINQISYGSSNHESVTKFTKTPIENVLVKKSYSSLRHPWAKGKWASDFIENIIKKIRSGVYYGVDRKDIKNKMYGAEVSTQTEINSSRNACCQNGTDIDLPSKLIVSKTDDPLTNLPGFDNTIATLEIETISTNQIAVKHCVTNVVVQFDIKVLTEASDFKYNANSMSCVPIHPEDNQEKIFKCNTTILNASLPAELCTIIPFMMRSILDSNKKLCPPVATVLGVGSPLKNISEMTAFEGPEVAMLSVLPRLIVPDHVKLTLNGKFPSINVSQYSHKITKIDLSLIANFKDCVASLFPKVDMVLSWHINQNSVIVHITKSNFNSLVDQKPNPSPNTSSKCMALELYKPRNMSVVPRFKNFNATNFVKTVFEKLNVIELLYTNSLNSSLKNTCYASFDTNNIVNRASVFPQGETNNALLETPINKIGVISLFNAFTKSNNNDNSFFGKALNDSNQNDVKNKIKNLVQSDKSKTELRKKGQSIKVLRKKSFVKCYRKCNSMSSISSYKSTQLNKITNLDDFCQVLGSNSFCSVLGGRLDKKILGAIAEMKNWITEITSKQALLILLLMDKKDTPNLIRFRPVLLQGIAVNRITRAIELDTEIEVIERENFNKIPQYEGISYLPASEENQDNLLEELYWIAKTTASDYQKTFDESSEKLLKSLIKKRKKLNPSYLRVMARYVGLGLLMPAK